MISPFETALATGAVFATAWIIADSKISLPFRRFVAARLSNDHLLLDFLECPPCLSFWLGLAVGLGIFRLGLASIALALVCVTVSLIFWRIVHE